MLSGPQILRYSNDWDEVQPMQFMDVANLDFLNLDRDVQNLKPIVGSCLLYRLIRSGGQKPEWI